MVNHRKKKTQKTELFTEESETKQPNTQRVQIRLSLSNNKSDRKESHINSEISSTKVPPGPSRNLAAVKDRL